MQRVVDLLGGWVEARPGRVLALLAAVTVVFGWLISFLVVETDIAEYAGDAPQATAFDRIDEVFGIRGGGLQVIVDAGRGGNVLSPDGLEVGDRIASIIDETIGDAVADDSPGRPPIVDYATPVLAGIGELDIDPIDLPPPFIAELLQEAIEEQGEEIRSLYSEDLDVDRATARGGLVSVRLEPGLDRDEREAAGVRLRDSLAAEDLGFLTVDPFSVELLEEELQAELFNELPILMALSLLAIVGLLWLQFRSVVDVLIAVTGLLLVQVWLMGAAALLGPELLRIIGPINQTSVAVPVMLVGLGVDYAVHLTARLREERGNGRLPAAAAGRAVRTVGVALLLVTLTTMVGFLANLRSPLPPIADFGVIVAVGMLAAFVVMGLWVPTVRQLVDRRVELPTHQPGRATGAAFDRVLGGAAGLAVRHPVTVIAVGTVLGVVGLIAAIDLDTEFSQEDFIPADTTADRLLTTMEQLFGGDVTEETFLLVEGDLTDAFLLEAFTTVEDRLLDIDDVQTVGGAGQVVTPRSLVEQLAEAGRLVQDQFVEQARVAVGDLPVTALVPLPGELELEDLPEELSEDVDVDADAPEIGPEVGPEVDTAEDLGERLERRLPPGVATDETLAGVIDPEELAELLREGTADELRDELLATLGRDTAEALAATSPEQVSAGLLEDLGYPMDELGERTIDLLAFVTDLPDLGWEDGRLAVDADPEALYSRVATIAGEDLAQVLSEDRDLALVIVPTEAGEEAARPLADDLTAAAEPLVAAGSEVMVVSEQLVVQETLDLLVEAQVEKILFSIGAALALLVAFYLLSQRRPMLGVITMVPTLLAIPIVLGGMWVLGLPFNALTATIASVAIGFGVDYGIHVSNRFREERGRADRPEDAVRETIAHTGAALVGSAATTAAAFAVLMVSDLLPVAQFGAITAMTMVAALIVTVLVQSSCLLIWERHHRRHGEDRDATEHGRAGAAVAQTGAG